ncbi:MAG: rhamnulokinase family protein [Bryobacteraceae bacterium]
MTRNFVALDLGAESGRAILGVLENGRLLLEELHRFPNQPVRLPTGLYWDTLRLWHEMLQGLAVAGRDRGLALHGIGVDTWGVDIALLGADGALVDNPRHYRDARNTGIPEKTFAVVPRAEIFSQTGLQFMQINSLYQWYAMKLAWAPAIDAARTLFFMPDLFHYFLTGVRKAERSIASTSQFYNPRFERWASEMLLALRLNPEILPDIVDPGTPLGPILPHVADLTGLAPDTPVFASAGHDTAAAVAAVPVTEPGGWCYVSSGTWSLMGIELTEPVLTSECLAMNFTNEIGVERRVRLLKNIMGMWPLQECRRAWAIEGHDYSYDGLAEMAAAQPPFASVLNPDAFLEPGHMPERIAAFCRETGQPAPESPGAFARAILESLALRYRQVLENLETLGGKPIHRIHIVGGGSRNRFLNQLVADCTGRIVVAGPTEATAAGNVLVQAMGAGFVAGLAEIREIVARSFQVERFEPRPGLDWEPAYRRFLDIAG